MMRKTSELALALRSAASVCAISWSVPAIAAATLLSMSAVPASAQDVQAEARPTVESEIIVTARKREESILQVPVVVTALTGAQIDNAQITSVTDLPRLVPGLVLGANILSIGPQVTIRGVGTSSYDPGVDQSVSLNIDGMPLGQGLAFRSGMFDVAQVEVLKGPQSLFYGKSSPGGVISLRTADPGSEFEIIGRASYEFEAREVRGDLIVSGPVTDTLGLRLAGTFSDADGYFRNLAVPVTETGAAAPGRREPQPRNFFIRGTALWQPTDTFTAKLKVNHSYDKAIHAELFQLAKCPEGNQAFGFGSGVPGSGIPPAPNFLTPVDPIPFIGGDDCKLNRNIYHVYLDPAAFPGVTNNGVPFLKSEQDFGTLEMNLDLSPQLTLSSNTSYYKLKSSSLVNANQSTAAGAVLAVTNDFKRRQFTQEFRLNSDFSGPANFSLGVFYEDGQLFDRVKFIRNRTFGFLPSNVLNDDRSTTMDIKTYSWFGQVRYELFEHFELAGGMRWMDETRTQRVFDYFNNVDLTPTLPRTRLHTSTVSPEFTATYTPTQDLTFFGSYKRASKSGSFKVAVPAVAGENNAFDDEQVKGYELGLKTRLFDRSLLANLAFYDYRYKGLQVGGIEPSVNAVPVIRTVNAGRARTYGVDFDLSYRPPSIEGLSLNGSINWNRARYAELNNIPCYTSQTVEQGCSNFFLASPDQTAPGPVGAVVENGQFGFYTGQDLSGTPMIRAPEWSANFGFDYELPVGSEMKLRLTNNNQYSSRYATFLAINRPNDDNYQRAYLKVDASIALSSKQDRWEIALIGKNITDKVISSTCSPGNFAGGNVIGGAITGGTIQGPPGFAEVGCYSDPGRAVYLRLTFKPFN